MMSAPMPSEFSTSKSDNTESNPPYTLFLCIIRMIAFAEGVVSQRTATEFDCSVNDLSYGILVNGSSRITYDKVVGLDIVNLE